MIGSRTFWLISAALLAFTIVANILFRTFIAFGLIGDLLFYGTIAGFLDFLLRQRWGWLLTMLVQFAFLTGYIFPAFFPLEFSLQLIGLGVLYMAKDEFG